jgi:hypothetical protein
MTYAQPGQEGSVEISYTLKCEEPYFWNIGL